MLKLNKRQYPISTPLQGGHLFEKCCLNELVGYLKVVRCNSKVFLYILNKKK